MQPFISICIPAYKNVAFLEKLFSSIAIQSFKNFEVIISDDSTDDRIVFLIKQYEDCIVIRYQKNVPPFGSSENWNAAMRLAKGQWIKLMHDDDWFESSSSLEQFAKAALEHSKCGFF